MKLFWDRAAEIGQGWYRPAQMARLRAGLDAQGRLAALKIRIAGTSLQPDYWGRDVALDRTAVQTLDDTRYRMPAYRVDYARRQVPVPTMPWRGVGATQNGFFLECFLDEVAQSGGRDPVELRRELLAHDPRALKVINLAAERSGWTTPPPPGRARGFAFVFSYGSLCAQVAEVSMLDGRPQVHRITAVLDCGAVVLPDAVRAQIEGAATQGLSAAMGEAVRHRRWPRAEHRLRQLPDPPPGRGAADRRPYRRERRGHGRRRRIAPAADRAGGGECLLAPDGTADPPPADPRRAEEVRRARQRIGTTATALNGEPSTSLVDQAR